MGVLVFLILAVLVLIFMTLSDLYSELIWFHNYFAFQERQRRKQLRPDDVVMTVNGHKVRGKDVGGHK
jgi:hypothetical protein